MASNDLGVIVTSNRLRRAIYALYVLALLAAGAVQVAYSSLALPNPSWLIAALAVLAYLGIPVGTIAVSNTVVAPKPTPAPKAVTAAPVPFATPFPFPITPSAIVPQPIEGYGPVAPLNPIAVNVPTVAPPTAF
jgi:hypothetical protein